MDRRVTTVALLAVLAISALPLGGCTLNDLAFALPLELTGPASSPAPATAPVVAAPAVSDSELLSASDIASACGVSGVRLAPKGSKAAAVGDVNFADPAENIILTITFERPAVYRAWKRLPSQYRGEVPGIGEEAFDGPAPGLAAFPTRLAFLYRGRAVALATYRRSDGTGPYLSEDQLKQVAAVLIGRL
jgi:hypothetical protein